MKHIKEFEQFVSEVKSYPNGPKYSDLEWRDALKGFDSDRYKMVRFSYDDEGNNATALIDKKNKKVISYSLTGKSEVDQYEKLVRESLNEAQKYDIEAAVKKIRDFNRGAYKKHGNNAVEELALDILDDLRITLTGGNVDDTIDHLGASMDDDDRIPEDRDLVREIYGITSA